MVLGNEGLELLYRTFVVYNNSRLVSSLARLDLTKKENILFFKMGQARPLFV